MAKSYHDDSRDPAKIYASVKYKNINNVIFNPSLSRVPKHIWHQINKRTSLKFNTVLLVIAILLLTSTFIFLIPDVIQLDQLIKSVLAIIPIFLLSAFVAVLIFKIQVTNTYNKLKKLKTNVPANIRHGSAYWITDERLPMFTFDEQLEKYAKLYAVLPWGMWILRWIKRDQNRANQQKWLTAALENFVFNEPRAPEIDRQIKNKIIHRTQYIGLFNDGRKNLQKISYSSANDVVSFLMRQLPATKVGKKTVFKTASTKNEVYNWLFKFCFEQVKPLPFFWIQSCADVSHEQDQPNALVLGKTGSGKTLSINIPTILANAYACEQPSFVILDPKGELEQSYAAVLKEQGYDVYSLNVFEIAKSQQWNPLDEGTRYSLMIATLVDLEKQYLNWKRFYKMKLNEDGQTLSWVEPYISDPRLQTTNTFGGVLSQVCDPLSLQEYLFLKRRYQELEATSTKFVFDPIYMAKNELWNNTPLYHPKVYHKNDPALKHKICVIHNKFSDFEYNPETIDTFDKYEQAVINYHHQQEQKRPKTKAHRWFNQARNIYREVDVWTRQQNEKISCDVCLLAEDGNTVKPTPEYVYEFNGGILFDLEQAIPIYIDKLATLRGNVTKNVSTVIVPASKNQDSHWVNGGRQVLSSYINKMFNWVQDWPHYVSHDMVNLVTLSYLINETTLRTETFFPEHTYLTTLTNEISAQATNKSATKPYQNPDNESSQDELANVFKSFSPYQMSLIQYRTKDLLTRNDYPTIVEFTGGKITEGGVTNPNFEVSPEASSRQSVGKVALQVYSSEPGAQNLVSYSTISIAKIINANKPQAVFVSFNVNEQTYHDYVMLFLSSMHQALSDLAKRQGGRLNRTWMFMLDEFGNLPEFPQLSEILATCRSEGIKFMLIIQDLSQLEKAYKKHEAIRSNCPFQIYIAPGTEHSSKAISSLFGQTTLIHKKKVGAGANIQEQNEYTSRNLITSDEALTLHTKEWNEMMVKIGSHPAIVSIPFIFNNLPNYEFLFRKQYRPLVYQRGLRFNPEKNLINTAQLSALEISNKKVKWLDLLIRPYGIDYQSKLIETDLQTTNSEDPDPNQLWSDQVINRQIHLQGAIDTSFNDLEFPIAAVLKHVYNLSFNDPQGMSKKSFVNLIAHHSGLLKIRPFLQNFIGLFGTKFNFDQTVFDLTINNLIEGSNWQPEVELSLFENYDYNFATNQVNSALIGYIKIIIDNQLDLAKTVQLAQGQAQLEQLLTTLYQAICAAFSYEISGHQIETITSNPDRDFITFLRAGVDSQLINRNHIDDQEYRLADLETFEMAKAQISAIDQSALNLYVLIVGYVAQFMYQTLEDATVHKINDWHLRLQPFISEDQWFNWLQMRIWKHLDRPYYLRQKPEQAAYFCFSTVFDHLITKHLNPTNCKKLIKHYQLEPPPPKADPDNLQS